MVEALQSAGHDVRTLTARAPSAGQAFARGVHATAWADINGFANALLGVEAATAVQDGYFDATGRSRLVDWLRRVYTSVLHFPDSRVGWLPFALLEGKRLLDRFPADLIVATARPYTSLVVAAILASYAGTRWVGDFRDLWMDNHYHVRGRVRSLLEKALEKSVLKSAAGFTGVVPSFVATLERRFHVPATVIYHGWSLASAETTVKTAEDTLRVAYAGRIYPKYQDPRPALHALRNMQENVRLCFLGTQSYWLGRLCHDIGVAASVEAPVPYSLVGRALRQSDVQLLLPWNDPRHRDILTAKLFDYLSCGKPILALGPKDTMAAEIVARSGAGVVLETSEEVTEYLRSAWIAKRSAGRLPGPELDLDYLRQFSLDEQRRRWVQFVESFRTERSARKNKTA